MRTRDLGSVGMRRLLVLLSVSLVVLSPGRIALAATAGDGTPCPPDLLSFFPRTGTELQRALDCASGGATITLRSSTVYEGSFVLRYKPVSYEADGVTPKRITIQSDALPSLLQQVPQRVSPSDEPQMAWLKVPAGSAAPVLTTELKTLPNGTTRLGASHYRLAGLKFFSNHWVNHLVRLGIGTERLVSELPSHITFDRSYFAGSRGEGTKQGLVANGVHVVVTNSYFKDFKDAFEGNDGKAIGIWNGAGPFLIQNNHLEGSAENMLVGGGDPTIPNLVPADFTIIGNYFVKPSAWAFETSTQPGRLGKKWRIKNLFELKNAQRVWIEGNVFENNWVQADQWGFAINFTPRNQSGGCPWCRIQDVTFVNNLVKNSVAGIKVVATDDSRPSGQLSRVTFRNNLFLHITPDAVPGGHPGDRAGRLVQIMNPYPTQSAVASPTGPLDLTFERNTAFSTREASFSVWGRASGVSFIDNVLRHNPCTSSTANDCGIAGTGTRPGSATFTRWFDDLEVAGNVFFAAGGYRATDYLPYQTNAFMDSSPFASTIDPTTGTGGSSPDYNVVRANGTKVGVDWNALEPLVDAALAGIALAYGSTVSVTATGTATEAGTIAGEFTVTRTGSTASALTVRYTVSGTATAGSDYATLSGSVTLPAGAASATIIVTPVNDAAMEGSETVIVRLAASPSYALGASSSASLTIVSDETVRITATDATATEAGPTTGTFTVTRTGSTAAALTVSYTVAGTATSGIDYVALSGRVVIPAGATTATITVTPINDTLMEGPETVIVRLAPSAGYTVGSPTSATVTITSDEIVRIAATDPTATEAGPTTGRFTVTRTGNATTALTVSYTVAGTATPGSDYIALTGRVVIPAGSTTATITITPARNTVAEGAETVVVRLASGPGYTIGAPSSATVTITEN